MTIAALPNTWVEATFDDVLADISNGIAIPQNKEGEGIPVSRIETIASGNVDFARIGFVYGVSEDEAERFLLSPGDILFSHINSPAHIGKTAVFRAGRLYHGTNLLRIKVDASICLVGYFEYYCRYFRAVGGFSLNAQHAVNQSSLNQKKIKAFSIPLPPLAEQTRIAAKLDELLAQVDTLKARIDGIPALLKRFRQSVLAAAVSGRLTEEWRAQHVGWVDEGSPTTEPNRNTESWTSQAQPNLQSELPAGWSAVPLGRYAINHDGARKPISAKERESRKGEHPYYGATGQIDSIDGYTHDGEFVLVGEDGANLLTRVKPIAFIAKGQIWVNNHAHVIASPSEHSNAYLAIYLNTLDITPWVSGSAQPKLNQKNMNEIPVHVPPPAEQTEIVRRVEQLFAFADQLEAKVATAQTRIDRLTQSILAKAFRGELVPQEPNDEPASLLLERIKAQRAAAPKAKRGRGKSMSA